MTAQAPAPDGVRRFLKITSGLDVAPIMSQIDAHPELWDQFTQRKTAPGTPHAEMSDIWVRYNDIAPYLARGNLTGFNDPHVPRNYPAWHALPALQDVAFRLMATVRGEMLGGVLITRIPPGNGIQPHVDTGWHVDYYDKFYLPLRSPEGSVFGCEDDELTPEVGDIWRFDNRRLHWVKNSGTEDRIMAIFCIRTDMFEKHS